MKRLWHYIPRYIDSWTGNTDMEIELDESEYPPAEQNVLPKDLIFDLLSNSRRRDVLEYLAEEDSKTTLKELAGHIAAKENDVEKELLSSQQRKRVYVALYQCHLPRMADADVLDYESGRGKVELRSEAAQLYQYMDVRPTDADETDTKSDQSVSDRVTATRTKIEEWVRDSVGDGDR